jgi:hypothetical protein
VIWNAIVSPCHWRVRQPRGYHPEARSNHRAGVLGARECGGGPDLVDAVQQRVQHDLGGGELALELLHGPGPMIAAVTAG